LQRSAMATLKGLGFEESELIASWNGSKDLSLRDHRMQLLIRDATLWRDAQAKAKAAVTRPVPPVQRPGVAGGTATAREAQLQALNKQLDGAKGSYDGAKAAAALLAARRRAVG
jgi:hypothetical protein